MKQMNTFEARTRRLAVLLAGLVLTLIVLHGQAYGQDNDQNTTVLNADNSDVSRVMDTQDTYTDLLLGVEGVVGTGTGVTDAGDLSVIVFTTEEIPAWMLPDQLDGIPVTQRVFGEAALTSAAYAPAGAAPPPPPPGADPTDRFTRPVPIGVSTSNWYDCGGGTIGARVTDGISTYILSCNHIFSRLNAASTGELIVQPGRLDVSCANIIADTIGRLADFQTITYGSYAQNNYMDAAIVQVEPGFVGTSTPSGGYGTPSKTIASPAVNQLVQEYGRGTSLTQGKVIAINTSIVIPYPAGSTRFNNQIVVADATNKDFAGFGDSGSLMVTDDNNANPVGLIFATTSTYTIASPIGPILQRFGVSIDDGSYGPLPVELTYFSGAMMDQDVHLKWRTETEIQNHAFHVQRSTDKNSWDDIAVIAGAGTSNTPRAYGHVDAGIGGRYRGQQLYYRLLQVDRDGTENYSSVLEIEPLPATAEMQIYPNPVRSDAVSTVQLSISEPMEGTLRVYDASGRMLDQYSQHLSLFNGTHVVPLTLSSATPGSYFLEFRSAKAVVRQRMIVVR